MSNLRKTHPSHASRLTLGPLEWQIMKVLWSAHECSVRDIVRRLPQARQYTTIMTTADRLFRKKILDRRKVDRKFIYSARLECQDLEIIAARRLTEELLAVLASSGARQLVISSVLESLCQHDPVSFEIAIQNVTEQSSGNWPSTTYFRERRLAAAR